MLAMECEIVNTILLEVIIFIYIIAYKNNECFQKEIICFTVIFT